MVSNIGKTRGTPLLPLSLSLSSDFQCCQRVELLAGVESPVYVNWGTKKDAYFMPVACYDSRRSSFPSISSFFLSLRPIPLSVSLSVLFSFFFFSPSHAFVLACLYTGHAFPRNGSAYELRARWEYEMKRNFWMQVGKQQYEIPGKSSAYMRAVEFIYMNFNKTCLYRIATRPRDNVFVSDGQRFRPSKTPVEVRYGTSVQ